MPTEVFAPLNLWEWMPWLSGLFALLWVLHLRVRNASLADVGFCLAFGIIVLACGVFTTGDLSRRVLISGMGIMYAARLGQHLFFNRVWRKTEDPRYQKIRTILGRWESAGMFCYFQLQVPACLLFAGLLCWVMSQPADGIRWWDSLGVMIFLLAIIGEALADRQLESFRQNPLNTGKTLQTGLWRYSRHHYYFFESLHWWAYVPLAVGFPWAWASVFWPILMTVSLLWVTGVPWAERQALASRGDSYREYQRNTSMFFPWFPRTSTMQSEI
jgi:steroid 5-alpha reductase family enzyme